MRNHTKTIIILAALGAVALTAGCSTTPSTDSSAAGTPSSGSLYGTWTMTSLEATVDGEYEDVPYTGQINFDEAGRMSTQAENLVDSAPDTDYTVQGYEAYYGALTVDEDANIFTVQIESSANEVLVGREAVRNYDISDNTLVITPENESEGWRVTYKRATP